MAKYSNHKTLLKPLFVCDHYDQKLKNLYMKGAGEIEDGAINMNIKKIFINEDKAYWEHTDHKTNNRIPPKRDLPVNYTRYFAPQIHVAPSYYPFDTPTTPRANIITPFEENFIFLDCGRWLKEHRNFGVVYGRHVYLCSYDDGTKNSEKVGEKFDFDVKIEWLREGLDKDFFVNMRRKDKNGNERNIRIINWATAFWGEHKDYDWEDIHIIIPDMHLMAGPIAKIWHKTEKTEYNMYAEIALHQFISDILDARQKNIGDNIKVIQIGDFYDLWVGHGFPRKLANRSEMPFDPLFEYCEDLEVLNIELLESEFRLWKEEYKKWYQTNNPQIYGPLEYKWWVNDRFIPDKFFENSFDYLISAIKHIQGISGDWLNEFNTYKDFKKNLDKDDDFKEIDLNPAEIAFRKLQNKLIDKVIYIYGNHDNYLISDNLYKRIDDKNFYKRQETYESGSLFIEHAHRMEKLFENVKYKSKYAYKKNKIPRNFDGIWNGFIATNETFLQLYLEFSPYSFTNLLPGDHSLHGKEAVDRTKTVIDDADWWAKEHDQDIYTDEFALFKLGRKGNNDRKKKAPNIFVIGHTHIPKLEYYNIRLVNFDG